MCELKQSSELGILSCQSKRRGASLSMRLLIMQDGARAGGHGAESRECRRYLFTPTSCKSASKSVDCSSAIIAAVAEVTCRR